MSWTRKPKPGSEPVEDSTRVVPKPTQQNERFCTTCNEWYNVKDADKHQH